MVLLVFSLSIFSIGLFIQLAILCRRYPVLRAKEQEYRFHDLRDELQLLAIRGRISQQSPVFDLLMSMLNLVIRNPGLMRLEDLVQLAKAGRNNVEEGRRINFEQLLQEECPEIKEFAGRCFYEYARMLMSNDRIVRFALWFGRTSRVLVVPLWKFMKSVTPTHAQAVKQAKWYTDTSSQFWPHLIAS